MHCKTNLTLFVEVTSNDVEQTDIQNMTKKGYRKELQRIIACNISNKK